ncbi:DUF4297 domain-containing protein [Pedobacter frigiditerrae]|uniref:DUF4297 domain-containing protein n=1 Tax=Pedobacter frigiditerrae TaxID=2530452 RepID=A0A4R0MYQ6_9SPHI|nr:dsDNA nuclease domain-containing protein [Pedobacter frigiditerrae]TCC92415.1 DUF4297 domain-containing protein [Pedobacter frigiditerrae]
MSGISALKGYRVQFLYSLYHILNLQDPNLTFRLEGIEDIDVYDEKNNLQCVIQVKHLTKQLSLSDLLSTNKTSFIKRYIQISKNSAQIQSLLISFGSISEELILLIKKEGMSLKEKDILRKYQLTEEEWLGFKTSTELLKVDENTVSNLILSKLKEQFPTIDPLPTAEILFFWLSYCAEKQESITLKKLFEKVEITATYLSERIAAANQLGKFIMPLQRIISNEGDYQLLKEEFYMGSSARYEHILSDFDVIRPNLLDEIEQQFKTSQVVMLQGASGQGKSTLAFRYIHQNAPEELVYELNLPDEVEKTREAILSIAGMSKALKAPLLLLVQVAPGTTGWLKVVAEFAHNSALRFLITIRQEDLFKAVASGIPFLHTTVEINFQKEEAESIYERLNAKQVDLYHADFEEAWIKFGGKGPLLEFVYMVTQGTPLKQKLQQQVRLLEIENGSTENITDFLRIVCLADTYGAKIGIHALAIYPKISMILNRLEKEYLLKITDDKKYIIGLHPQRSKILLEFLFDEFILERASYVVKCLKYLDAQDIYFFLLHIFNDKLISPENLLNELKGFEKMSWSNYSAIFKAFLWSGVSSYLNNNIDVYQSAYDRVKSAWYIVTDVYFGQAFDQKTFLNAEIFNEDIRQYSEDANKKLSNKSDVFLYVQKMIALNLLPDSPPKNGKEWEIYGEMLFWFNQTNQNEQILIFSESDYNDGFILTDVKQLSTLMLGMYLNDTFTNQFRISNHGIFIEKLKETYSIAGFSLEDQEVKADYLVDILQQDQKISLNDRSVEIIDLLRRAFPDKLKFTVHGIGHQLDALPQPYDDSYKSIAIENLPLTEWTSMNYTLINLFTYLQRPLDWEHYHTELNLWETEVKNKLNDFNQCLKKFFKSKTDYKELAPIVQNINYNSGHELLSPRHIVDPFGIYSKALRLQAKGSSLTIESFQYVQETEKAAILQSKYDFFTKSLSDFKSHFDNFLRQSASALYAKIMESSNTKPENYENRLKDERVSQYNLFKAIQFYPEMLIEKNKRFSKYVGVNTNTSPYLFDTAFLWHSFVSGSYLKKQNFNVRQNTDQLKNNIINRLRALLKRADTSENFKFSFRMDEKTGFKPIVLIEADSPFMFLKSLQPAFEAIKQVISTEGMGLKRLVLDLNFSTVYLLPTIQNYTLNNSWYEFPIYTFESKSFEELNVFNFAPKVIDANVFTSLGLMDWSTLLTKMNDVKEGLSEFMKLQLYVQHLKEISILETKEMDKFTEKLLIHEFNQYGKLISESFQKCLIYLGNLANEIHSGEINGDDEYEVMLMQNFVEISNNLYPKKRSKVGELSFNLSQTPIWSERLKICMDKLGIASFLVWGKYIEDYNLDQVKKTSKDDGNSNISSVLDLFNINFNNIPDNSFIKGKSETNSDGTQLTNYRKKINFKECGLFDSIHIKYFSEKKYNITFESSIINFNTIAALKHLIGRLYKIYGIDDIGTGIFTTSEGLDILAGRHWTGRMWLDIKSDTGLVEIMLSIFDKKIEMTLFSPIR